MDTDELIYAISEENNKPWAEDNEDVMLDYEQESDETGTPNEESMYESSKVYADISELEEEDLLDHYNDKKKMTPMPGEVGHEEEYTNEDRKEAEKVHAEQLKDRQNERLRNESMVFAAQQDAQKIARKKTEVKQRVELLNTEMTQSKQQVQRQDEEIQRKRELIRKLKEENRKPNGRCT